MSTRTKGKSGKGGEGVSLRTFEFTLALSTPPDDLSDAELDRLYEAGCDDALIGRTAGVWRAIFGREAPTLAEAVLSAVRDVEAAAVEGLAVEGVKADVPGELDESELAFIGYVDALLRARRLAPKVAEARALADRLLTEVH